MTKSKSNRSPRLALSRETLHALTRDQMAQVAGGLRASVYSCPCSQIVCLPFTMAC